MLALSNGGFRQAITIADDSANIELLLEVSLGAIRGRLLDENSEPAERGTMWLVSGSAAITSTPVLPDGSYELRALPLGGRFEVRAGAEGYGQRGVAGRRDCPGLDVPPRGDHCGNRQRPDPVAGRPGLSGS